MQIYEPVVKVCATAQWVFLRLYGRSLGRCCYSRRMFIRPSRMLEKLSRRLHAPKTGSVRHPFAHLNLTVH